MYNEEGYPETSAKLANSIGAPIARTRRQRLEQAQRELEKQRSNVEAALGALDDNPNVEDVMNKIDAAM